MEKPLHRPGPPRIIISGGGTGGHVFPAIAIGLALKRKVYNAQILFVGARGRMEMQKVPQAGFHIIGLDIAGLQRRMSSKNLLLPFKLIKSLAGAKAIVKRFKPDLVIGVGGYASAPLLWASIKQKVPVMIQEQNSFPGLTNRFFGKKADRICVAYEGMDKYFKKEKIYLTGNPVRHDVVMTEGKRDKALSYFGLRDDRPVLFSTGGSLGALTINRAICNSLDLFARQGVQLIWQTGRAFFEKANEAAREHSGAGIYIAPFIDRMDYAYAAADLVVSRAGAIAVSEICTVGKPAIFIPSPNVAEDHQTKNALALVNHHAALMIKDSEAVGSLGETACGLIKDSDKMHRLREKMAGLSYRDAADLIAGAAVEMINKKHRNKQTG